jgi:citrate lyase subunit beta/citryl-CoA lyase
MQDEFRPLRSLLFAPASNGRALQKAGELPCDGVIVDLEDSVAPEAKAEAREAAAEALARGFGPRAAVLRCNGPDTDWAEADAAAAVRAGPDAVLVPKVRSAQDVRAWDQALSKAPERTRLWVMIETPQAVLELAAIAGLASSTRLAGLVLGLNDLMLELRAKDRAGLQPVLLQAVLAARAHGLLAFDSVFNAFEDEAGLEAECRRAAGLGFDGKTLIHPRQIEPCNRAFSPSPEEAAWARKVVEAFAAPEAAGRGAIRLEGRMVERLHLQEARRTLRLAEG